MKIKHINLFIFIIFLIFLVNLVYSYPRYTFAAKKRIRQSLPAKNIVSVSSVKLRPDRLGIILSINNLQNLKRITYLLSYQGNGVNQGVQGSITPGEKISENREILFATCSKNVCTWHNNLQNMKLAVTSYFKSGAISTKTYRIKP